MSAEVHTEMVWLNTTAELSVQELVDQSGLSEADIYHYLENGVIVPLNPQASRPVFGAYYGTTLSAAKRLRDTFELDTQSLAVVIALLKRIHYLEAQLQQVQSRQY